MRYPDWKCDAQTVLREARLVIQEFAATHPSETCSFLAFGVNYYEGWVSINFDTPSNSIKRARRRAFRVRQSQQMLLDREDGWKDARYYLTRERMSGINMEIASFQYSSYKVLSFDQWVDYFAALPEAEDHSGHILMLFTEVVHELSRKHAYSSLQIGSPFYTGVQVADDELGMQIMDISNWPS